MEGWVGTTIAISLAIMAVCSAGMAVVMLTAIKETRGATQSLGKELSELRNELSPALHAINHLGESGAEIAEMARTEIGEIVEMSKRMRHDIRRGTRRARARLADFDALVEVVQEEVEETALDLTTALQTVRTGSSVVGRLRRLMLPGRRRR